MMARNVRGRRTCLGDFDIVNLEFCVWMRLLCVENLLNSDGSEGVFAICSLQLQCQLGREGERPDATQKVPFQLHLGSHFLP